MQLTCAYKKSNDFSKINDFVDQKMYFKFCNI